MYIDRTTPSLSSVFSLSLFPFSLSLGRAERVQFCEHDQATISCPQGEGISIVRANYGRTDGASICANNQIFTTDCRLPSGTGGGGKVVYQITTHTYIQNPIALLK